MSMYYGSLVPTAIASAITSCGILLVVVDVLMYMYMKYAYCFIFLLLLICHLCTFGNHPCTLSLQAKHLQFVSGADITSYWIANLLWDLFNSLFPILASVVVIAVFRQEAYSGTALFGILLLLVHTYPGSIHVHA